MNKLLGNEGMRRSVETKPASTRITPERLEHWLWMAFVSTNVISLLTTSDAPPQFALFLLPNLFWLLLALALACLGVWQPRAHWQCNRVDTFIVLWLLWQGIACCAVMGSGDLRAAINGGWQAVSFALAIGVGRRLLASEERRTAMLTLLLLLAGTQSLLAWYQFAVDGPALRRAIEADPQAALQAAGIQEPMAAEVSQLYLARAKSVEPLGTFTLTNSLAGFLLPALMLLLSGMSKLWRQVWPWLLLLGSCLLLTQSRTAWLAMLAGIGLWLLRSRGFGHRWIIILVLGGVVIGGLLLGFVNPALWQDAPKSVLYRLEYWYSTLSMIRQHALVGVGPGNFQSVYPRYQLPQASETVADPHNFLLEIAATQGMLGLLLWLGLMWSCVCDARKTPPATASLPPQTNAYAGMLIGGAWGVLLTPGVLLLNEVDTNWLWGMPVLFWAGAALLIVAWCFAPVGAKQVGFSSDAALWALLVLLLNLMAAGGISFPAISHTLAILLACLAAQQPVSQFVSSQPFASRRSAWAGVALGTALLIGYYFTAYAPVLNARRHWQQAQDAAAQHDLERTRLSLQQAMQADVWNAELPWQAAQLLERLPDSTQLELEQYWELTLTRHPRSARWRVAACEFLLRRPCGALFREQLERLLPDLIELQPNSARVRAIVALAYFQLSFDATPSTTSEKLHTADYRNAIQQHAHAALALDVLNPHRERKLANQSLANYVRLTAQWPHRAHAATSQQIELPQNMEQAMGFLLTAD